VTGSPPASGGAGLILLAADDSIVATDAAGEWWLAQLGAGKPDAPVPSVVAAVARGARRTRDERRPLPVRARVRARGGSWLVVRGSALGGEGDACAAVTIERASGHDLAPLIADACELTERERAITRLVAEGLATRAIAGRLHVSPWTVQDHLKTIFEKVGVRTRGELVAHVFFEHQTPRLSERA
jgi:DNA-binding CsgD family transcriptional regulator